MLDDITSSTILDCNYFSNKKTIMFQEAENEENKVEDILKFLS